jgi:hypothetical protein
MSFDDGSERSQSHRPDGLILGREPPQLLEGGGAWYCATGD